MTKLMQRYIFENLEPNDCVVSFGREHEHLHKILRHNIVGGSSIVIQMYQEQGL